MARGLELGSTNAHVEATLHSQFKVFWSRAVCVPRVVVLWRALRTSIWFKGFWNLWGLAGTVGHQLRSLGVLALDYRVLALASGGARPVFAAHEG